MAVNLKHGTKDSTSEGIQADGYDISGRHALQPIIIVADEQDEADKCQDEDLEGDDDEDQEDAEEEEAQIDEKQEIQLEINQFIKDFPHCPFKIIDKIGQGTFSSVYIAVDVRHHAYDNSDWCLFHVGKGGITNATCGKVALKRIYATSSPTRIITELNLLKCPYIASLITAIRHEDQVVAVLPYFEHDNFKKFYKKMLPHEISRYMFCMISALSHVHTLGYIHRDVKPSNFLFNVSIQRGVLIDFGLAQREPDLKEVRSEMASRHSSIQGRPPLNGQRTGYLLNDSRPSIRASRAGTRGFRAPEVLFKYTGQTRALDMWSVGVTLLCILSGQFPFFQSSDDTEALMEISHIFGRERMKEVAFSLGRHFDTNLPSIGAAKTLESVIEKLNPGVVSRVGASIISLLEGLLQPEFHKRLTAPEALRHPFFAQYPQK